MCNKCNNGSDMIYGKGGKVFVLPQLSIKSPRIPWFSVYAKLLFMTTFLRSHKQGFDSQNDTRTPGGPGLAAFSILPIWQLDSYIRSFAFRIAHLPNPRCLLTVAINIPTLSVCS